MSNSNFGYDCRNNLDNCQFLPIFDELKEITYLKWYYNYFDSKVSSFVTTDLIKQEVQEKCNDLKMKLSKDDKFYEINIECRKKWSFRISRQLWKKMSKTIEKKNPFHYLERGRSIQKQ